LPVKKIINFVIADVSIEEYFSIPVEEYPDRSARGRWWTFYTASFI